jgi:O-antigen/teichoic acid export membrane protein
VTDRSRRRETLRGGLAIAAATGLMNAATYGFTLIGARTLGPTGYGVFAAMLGIVIVVNVVSLGLQATGARRVAAAPGDRGVIEARVMAVSVRCGVVLAVFCLAAAPLVSSALALDSWPTAALLAVPAFCFSVMGGQAGILQGEGRWFALATVFVSLGVARIGIGSVALSVSATPFSATLGGIAVASVVPLAVGAMALRRTAVATTISPPATGRTHSRVLREVVLSSHALFAFFALSTADVVVARIVLDEHEAGLYAAGLILAKAVLFLPQFVIVVAFPAMARHGADHRLHLWGLGVVLTVGGAVALVAAVLPGLALVFVGGHAYAEASGTLWAFAVVGTLLAAVQLLVYSALARRHQRSVALLWLALATIVIGAMSVHTGAALLTLVCGVDAALLAALVVITRRDDVTQRDRFDGLDTRAAEPVVRV